jgi:hypothetical protein
MPKITKTNASLSPSDQRSKRVLWLNNHTTARMVECELLRHFGYEVYTPKYVPKHIRSASVDYSYDKSLSIPAEALEILNRHDFYEYEWPMPVHAVLNEYFGTAIIGCFSWISNEIINHFRGRILLRSYGPTRDDYTVWRLFNEEMNPGFINRISNTHDRLWFAQAYPNLAGPEHDFFKLRAVTLPTGIPKHFYEERGCYQRKYEKILMVLPDIKAGDQQSSRAYAMSRKYFKGIPKIIAGNQFTPVENDPEVTGLLPSGHYDKYLKGCAAMFYHNELPRHIHFHPVEAACYGMPVIFMASGMISHLGGKDAPGSSKTYAEARKKIKRILKGDEKFIQEVIESQREWVDYFSWDENLKGWETGFQKHIMSRPLPALPKAKMRIALLLSGHAGWYMPDYVESLINMIRQGLNHEQGEAEIVIGLEKSHYNESQAKKLEQSGHSVRMFEWRSASKNEIRNAIYFTKSLHKFEDETLIFAHDGISCFEDCTALFILADNLRGDAPIAPLRPFILHFNDAPHAHLSKPSHARGITTSSGYASAVTAHSQISLNHAWEQHGFDHEKSYLLPLLPSPKTPLPHRPKQIAHSFAWLLLAGSDYLLPACPAATQHQNKEKYTYKTTDHLEDRLAKRSLLHRMLATKQAEHSNSGLDEPALHRAGGPLEWLKLSGLDNWKISIAGHQRQSETGKAEIVPHHLAENMLPKASFIWLPEPSVIDITVAWISQTHDVPLLLPSGDIADMFAAQGAIIYPYRKDKMESWTEQLHLLSFEQKRSHSSKKPVSNPGEVNHSLLWHHMIHAL